MNIAKFYRTPFLQNTSMRLLLKVIINLLSRTRLIKQRQEIKQNWRGRETLISTFCPLESNFFVEERLGTKLCLYPFLSLYHNFQVFSRSATREATRILCFLYRISCTTFLVVNRTTLKS